MEWSQSSGRSLPLVVVGGGHTTLVGTKGVWTLRRICCDGDFMVGRSFISCARKSLQQKCVTVIIPEQGTMNILH